MDQNNQDSEISLTKIFELMKKNIFDNYLNYSNSSISKDYISSRKSLFSVLHKITNKMGFKSQTFFLCAQYLDIVFSKKKRINCNLNTLGLASLCLSAKFCENDPIVPHLQYFIRVYNYIMGYKNIISMSDLKRTEVLLLKMLNYKLNYYTIYDFNSFLFGHGILKIEQLKDIENKNKKHYQSNRKEFVINATNSIFIKNILEKIYKKSRMYLDNIIDNTKLCFKYNPMYLSIFVMKKSVEEILYVEQKINSSNKEEQNEFYAKNNECFKQIMSDFYKIDYETNSQYKKILTDGEITAIFGGREKTGEDAAPLADKKILKEDEKKIDNNNIDLDSNININEEIENKSKNSNTYSSCFYNKLKVKSNLENNSNRRQKEKIINNSKKENTNINFNNRNIGNNSENKVEGKRDEEEEDDLECNLNINELQNVKWNNNNKSKNSIKKEEIQSSNKLVQNKYNFSSNSRTIKKLDAYNNISNSNTNIISKTNFNNNYNLTNSVNTYRGEKTGLNKYLVEPKTEKNSPKKCNVLNNCFNSNKYTKIKSLNTGNDRNEISYISNENNNNYNYNTIKKYEKQPYFKKLIHQNTNDNVNSAFNSINRSGTSSYYNRNNYNSEVNRNKVIEKTVISSDYNTLNKDSTIKDRVGPKINSYYSNIGIRKGRNEDIMGNKSINNEIYENKINNKDLNQKGSTIVTTSSRYRKKGILSSNVNINSNLNINDI